MWGDLQKRVMTVPKSSESIRDSWGRCIHKDANQKFLRSLPSVWSQVSLIMRTKPGVDSLSFDDLYNNLRVFENDVKGSTASSSSTQNVAFVFENTSSTNDVSTAYSVSDTSGQNSQRNGLKWQVAKDFDEKRKVPTKRLVKATHFDAKEPIEILSYENEVLQSVFMNKESELEKQPLYDRFVTAGGMHVVPPPMTGNYMPSGPNVEIGYSQFTYGPNQSQPSESETQTSDFDTCESDCSVETTVNEPKVILQPKVWSDAPIIEEYESDSEDEHESQPTKEQEQPIFASTNKQVKTPRETVKNQFTHSKNPIVDKKGLRYGFTARACFVCGSLSHLIRDCDFHEKRMAKQAELNNSMRMKFSQTKIRPIWNNVQRVNHKNQFVPTAVLTRTGKIPVNTARASGTNNVSTARHDFNRQAVPTNAAMKVIDFKPIALKHKGIIDSGCSRHLTGNKAYLAAYQEFNGGPVAFGGSKGYITSKGKIKTRKLDFEDVCFVKELQHFNLFSVSQICDKKNKVLFTDSECLVLSPEFKLPDENQVLLRIPRQNNMYSFNLKNIVLGPWYRILLAFVR
ncbi:hypothetical protein Tco_1018099 [Tanacetum coccineum]|uniref:Retrovirus-related Pol polyprotein from transposon TNT 1-94-like beta-barrel domain-containing protein n=1 Tax=Tanacetum coccineum TaxID=301880 RepID=A0ABQ5FUF5_9ASTR